MDMDMDMNVEMDKDIGINKDMDLDMDIDTLLSRKGIFRNNYKFFIPKRSPQVSFS
jgi:hypothetical protein